MSLHYFYYAETVKDGRTGQPVVTTRFLNLARVVLARAQPGHAEVHFDGRTVHLRGAEADAFVLALRHLSVSPPGPGGQP